MTRTDLQKEAEVELGLSFSGTIPQAYDEFLAPYIFNPLAEELAKHVSILPDQEVLELACGTGSYTQQLIKLIPESSTLLATDLSKDMLAIATGKIEAANIDWDICDISNLHYKQGRFDLVTSQFGLMFLKDKLAAFSDMKTVLKPGGSLVFNTWASPSQNRIWQTVSTLVSSMIGPAPASFNAVGPFSMSDGNLVASMLKEAGFSHVEHSAQPLSITINSALEAAKGFIYGLPFREAILRHDPQLLDTTVTRLQRELEMQFGGKPLQTQVEAIVFKAFK